ncbi:TetR/AcrR family transcriptional regulator [Actinocatenispora rupis]|uniref:TetR family transcriptional regulator n=1 Tax=Actinocatenispora rupis TaxID=519421 RepID=A0A8J3JGH0_9ACTN|nr:TetR/AcrR family transcriptional regulator [Actinocatenispora rupis]GID15478.1 TetR family transcriptional regulator [Actinocatenispora rupis]
MARWDPGTAQRLTRAALELCTEHGYDNVTVTQIAERAGITRRSYFRYFPDKREVLFAGSERLAPAVGDAVRAVEGDGAPLTVALTALARVGTLLVDHLDRTAERRAVIASSPELQERERTKTAAVTAAIGDALRHRGVDADRARTAAQLATVAFQNAFDRWIDAQGRTDIAACLDAAVAELRDTLTADTGRPHRPRRSPRTGRGR